jgi:hypothetical protein
VVVVMVVMAVVMVSVVVVMAMMVMVVTMMVMPATGVSHGRSAQCESRTGGHDKHSTTQ